MPLCFRVYICDDNQNNPSNNDQESESEDKKDQNKDPVGPQHEGIVSGAGKVAGAAIGGALGLGVSPALGVATGAGIIKGTDKIQKALDKKKLALKKSKKKIIQGLISYDKDNRIFQNLILKLAKNG